MLFHAGAQKGDDWVVVEVWESSEKMEKFATVLMPSIQKAGIKVEGGKPDMLKVHYMQTA
jgi:hypothetical protein